jgi:hypothetical protein
MNRGFDRKCELYESLSLALQAKGIMLKHYIIQSKHYRSSSIQRVRFESFSAETIKTVAALLAS